MATIASAKAKLAAKIPYMPGNYNEGIARFLGVSEGQIASSPAGQAYAAKIRPGVEDEWERKYRQAFGA